MTQNRARQCVFMELAWNNLPRYEQFGQEQIYSYCAAVNLENFDQ